MTHEPTHLDLFAGIGGFAIAAQWAGFHTVAFCEIDPYCQAVIKARFGAIVADTDRTGKPPSREDRRMGRKQELPTLFSDIRKLDGQLYTGVSLITGGFPCQPFSCAGKRRGKEDDRFLWPEMLRVVSEARPAWVLGENVAGIINMELDRCLSDLENIGYAVWPLVIPACAVDARHRRDRVWIVAHSGRGGWESWGAKWGGKIGAGACDEPCKPGQDSKTLADAECHGYDHTQPRLVENAAKGSLGQHHEYGEAFGSRPDADSRRKLLERWNGKPAEGPTQWSPEPDVGRVAHGIPARVDRLKGLGNAIVPQVAFEILKAIHEITTFMRARTHNILKLPSPGVR